MVTTVRKGTVGAKVTVVVTVAKGTTRPRAEAEEVTALMPNGLRHDHDS